MGMLLGRLLGGLAAVGVGLPSMLQAQPAEPSGAAVAAALQESLTAAIAKAEKSVVAIARVRKADPMADPLRRRILEAGPTSPDFVPNEYATGVVIEPRGLILTTYHVLGNPDENDYWIWVNQAPFAVKRVQRIRAADPWFDLAVLQVEAEGLTPISFGSADKLSKGQFVVALGNPYGIAHDGEVSATWGIISNLKRQAPRDPRARVRRQNVHQYGTLIQTDAQLPKGTSGGALINLRGEMIGLTTSLADRVGYAKSSGFAIPVDEAFKRTVERLKQGQEAEYGFLGIEPAALTAGERREGRRGARVQDVVPNTPAHTADLRPNDVITHVNDQQVNHHLDLIRLLSSEPAGETVELKLIRRQNPLRTQVRLSKKFMSTPRPPYAEIPPRVWRGVRVEYATAMPSFNSMAADRLGCVGVLAVERESPAWQAGLRAGDYVSLVDRSRVATPDDFHRAVKDQAGPVKLRLSSRPPGENELVVPPDAEPAPK